jgi:hypothetical protein
MEGFKKIVRLGTIPEHHSGYSKKMPANIFCEIKFEGKRLSITGVIGPLSNGDAVGSCGQIDTTLRERRSEIKLAAGWTDPMLDRFLAVWDEWHLNDMCAYDGEMKAAGWRELAKKPMKGYEFTIKTEVYRRCKVHEEAAMRDLKKGVTVSWDEETRALLALAYGYKQWVYADEPEPQPREHYERAKDHNGNVKHPETKTLGWLYPSYTEHLREDWHPDGLLTRKLRPDGPGYGSAWYFHEVPAEVIDFLRSLPDTDINPAWV